MNPKQKPSTSLINIHKWPNESRVYKLLHKNCIYLARNFAWISVLVNYRSGEEWWSHKLTSSSTAESLPTLWNWTFGTGSPCEIQESSTTPSFRPVTFANSEMEGGTEEKKVKYLNITNLCLSISTLSLPAYHCRQWKSSRIYASTVRKGLK